MLKDEFEWIKSITPHTHFQNELVTGIGDDAALWSVSGEMDQVVCVDTMVEGVHFTKSTLTTAQVGRKALAVNVSDLAAMGAIPLFYLVSIAIPKDWTASELSELYTGMQKLGKEYNMDLIGGDTVSTKGPLVLTVTVIGKVEKGIQLLRKNAKRDDVVFLTGITGESAVGLELLLERTKDSKYLPDELIFVQKHQEPHPHVEQGRIFAESGFRVALNDVSDGVASELNEIAEASHVTIHIEEDKLPTTGGLDVYSKNKRLEYQLFGGEDYVLVGCMEKTDFEKIRAIFEKRKLPIYRIGKVVDSGKPVVYLQKRNDAELEWLTKKGFNHFRER